MARQFVHGKRFFLDEFGIETAGGLAARLLRLHRRAAAAGRSCPGRRWFLTQKMSWNQTNRFPHHTFWWEGIDGTRVFTHFPPVDTYNSELLGRETGPRRPRNFAEKGARHPLAGPVRLRRRRRRPHPRDAGAAPAGCADLEGSPRVTIETPGDVLRDGARPSTPTPPVWVGELYLELHRGTYTTPGQDQAGQPAQRAPAARGRAVVGDRRRAHRAPLPVRATSTGSGRPCCCTSSTTSCPAPRSRGCTARPRHLRSGRRASWRRSSARRRRRWPATRRPAPT